MDTTELIIDCCKVALNLTPAPNLVNIIRIADKIGREQGRKPMMSDATWDKIQSLMTIHFKKEQKPEWKV